MILRLLFTLMLELDVEAANVEADSEAYELMLTLTVRLTN